MLLDLEEEEKKLQDQENSSSESDSLLIPMERDSKNGHIISSGISEYDEHEAINIPIINTLNSN